MFRAFLLIIPLASCVVGDDFTLPPHAVSRDKDGNKVAWPMYDFDLEENLVNHGAHCVDKVQNCLDLIAGNGTKEDMEEDQLVHRMHCAHCQTLVRLVKRFYEAHPDFHVSTDLCSVVSQVRKRRVIGGYGFPACRLPDQFPFPRSIRAIRSTNRKSLGDQENDLKDKNFGELLMKDWKGEQLTKFEANFMRRIESEDAVMATARALTCKSGPLAYMELTYLVKDSHDICW